MEEEIKYLYSVNPRRTIKLKGLLPLRTSKSLYLSKDQVRECLKYGSVYRRFANINRIEKVVGLDVDRLHNAEFYTPEEWAKKLANGEVTVEETKPEVVEEPTVEEPNKDEVINKGEPDTVVEEANEAGAETLPAVDENDDASENTDEVSAAQEPVNNDIQENESMDEETDAVEATEDVTVSEDTVNVDAEEEDEMPTQVPDEDQDVDNPDRPQNITVNVSNEGRRKKKRKH